MLLDEISSEESLKFAWDKLNKSNPLSHGISGETIEDVRTNLHNILSSISKNLQDHSYQLRPTRAALIPKDNEDFRPLRIPEVRDRIVLKSIAIKIEELLSDELEKSKGVSFAYQKGVGIEQALITLKKGYEQGYTVVLKCDIIKFFDAIDRSVLLQEKLYNHLPDDSINNLIETAINQEVGNIEEIDKSHRFLFETTSKGIPQGNPLSPLFSNLYLSGFDQYMKDEGYKLIRYADDFIVLLEGREQAKECYSKIKTYLKKNLSLDIHPLERDGKSTIINLENESVVFLSVEFDGQQLLPSKNNVERLLEKFKAACSQTDKFPNVLVLLKKLKYTLEGWISTYSFTNVEYYIRRIDYELNHQILKALYKFGWNLTSDSLSALPEEYRRANSRYACLSKIQRKRSGIPLSGEILRDQREKISESDENG